MSSVSVSRRVSEALKRVLGPSRKFTPFSPMTFASPIGVGLGVAVRVGVLVGVSVMVADGVVDGLSVDDGAAVAVSVGVQVGGNVLVGRVVAVWVTLGRRINVGRCASSTFGWQAFAQKRVTAMRRWMSCRGLVPSTMFFASRIIFRTNTLIVNPITGMNLTIAELLVYGR
jgi:hypothetical protein